MAGAAASLERAQALSDEGSVVEAIEEIGRLIGLRGCDAELMMSAPQYVRMAYE